MRTKGVLPTYESFQNARGHKRQLGFDLSTWEEHGTSNNIDDSPSQCLDSSQSVIAWKVHTVVLGFHRAILHPLQEVLDRRTYLDSDVDSKTEFYIVLKDQQANKQTMKIYVNALNALYKRYELPHVCMDCMGNEWQLVDLRKNH